MSTISVLKTFFNVFSTPKTNSDVTNKQKRFKSPEKSWWCGPDERSSCSQPAACWRRCWRGAAAASRPDCQVHLQIVSTISISYAGNEKRVGKCVIEMFHQGEG